MKKTISRISLLLALIFVFVMCFVACGDDAPPAGDSSSNGGAASSEKEDSTNNSKPANSNRPSSGSSDKNDPNEDNPGTDNSGTGDSGTGDSGTGDSGTDKPGDVTGGFTVKFDTSRESSPTAIADQKVEANGKVTKPDHEPYRKGSEFLGWFVDGNSNNPAWDFDNDVVTKDITLVAVFARPGAGGNGGSTIVTSNIGGNGGSGINGSNGGNGGIGGNGGVSGIKRKPRTAILASDGLCIASAIGRSVILALASGTEGEISHRSADSVIRERRLNGIAGTADRTALEGIAIASIGGIVHLPLARLARRKIGGNDGQQIARLTFRNDKGVRAKVDGNLDRIADLGVQIHRPRGGRRQKALDKAVQCLHHSEGAHRDAATDVPHLARYATGHRLSADEGAVAHPLYQSAEGYGACI